MPLFFVLPDAPTEVAEGKVATQSTTAFQGNAAKAVDGVTNGVFSSFSCSHTDKEVNPWWTVRLGRRVSVTNVVVYNRVDANSEHLSNMKITVGKITWSKNEIFILSNTFQSFCTCFYLQGKTQYTMMFASLMYRWLEKEVALFIVLSR